MLHPLTKFKDNVVTAIKNARDAFNDPLNTVVQQKLREAFPDKFKNSSLPAILLSHHEPISSHAQEFSDGQNLRIDFQKFLAAAGRPPFGWFFGHEHLCTIYDFKPDLFPTRGRLIGHGSIPHSPPAPGQQADPGCFPAFLMNTKANDDGDAVSGFALLKFDRETIYIGYINEDGSVFHNETWVAN
jgi:hypothetical protein